MIIRKHFTFVDIYVAKQMIIDGFKGPFYGRYMIDSIFEDPILYSKESIELNYLRHFMKFEGGCIPLPTIEQYHEFRLHNSN
jgi:hypothetical protein